MHTLTPCAVGEHALATQAPSSCAALMSFTSFPKADLPPVIQRAIARLMDPAFPVQINAPELKAMATLLRRVDKTDGTREFRVKRVNLGELFGRCERTVTNWLNALEAAGLIVKEQGRSGWGRFQSAVLELTPLAISLLGLDQPMRKPSPDLQAPGPDQLRKKTSPRLYVPAFEFQSSSKRQPAGMLSTGSEHENEPRIQDATTSGDPSVEKPKRQACDLVPDDCKPLLEMNVTPFGIFQLMKQARLAGKRLADIVAARSEALRSARHTYSLVKYLIGDAVDYSVIRQWQAEKARKAQEVHKKEVILEDTKERWVVNQWLVLSEPGVQDHAARLRVRVHKEGLPEVHVQENGKIQYKGVIAGADLVDFWRSQGRWSGLRLLS